MNKRQARQEAYRNTRTNKEYREMIAAARGRGGMSKVNPQFTLEQTLDMYEGGLKGGDEHVMGERVGDILFITNMLRDCSPYG